MDLYHSAAFLVVGTLISTYLVAMAYKNTKFVLKHKSVDCFLYPSVMHAFCPAILQYRAVVNKKILYNSIVGNQY